MTPKLLFQEFFSSIIVNFRNKTDSIFKIFTPKFSEVLHQRKNMVATWKTSSKYSIICREKEWRWAPSNIAPDSFPTPQITYFFFPWSFFHPISYYCKYLFSKCSFQSTAFPLSTTSYQNSSTLNFKYDLY